ncbi:MAG: hypothetical protein M1840_003365 [Geoglossum simile]|nr:MAG: hypothetical protein M1840_003365 [Geoglossum simile]
METGKPQKQQARTSLGSAEIWTSCTEGCGWVWLENACNPDGDCQDGWENRVAYRDREGFLGPESIEPTIHKSTTLNGVTKGAILYGALQGGKVLVIPHQPMVHFIESGTKKPDVGRVVGAPLYKKGDRSVVLMKMQFSGGPGTIYRVFLADDSHKMESDDGEITAVDIPAHAEYITQPN